MGFLTPPSPKIIMPEEPEPTVPMPDPGDVRKRKRKQQEAAMRYQSGTIFEDAAQDTRQTLG